jgi:hypothetical protein
VAVRAVPVMASLRLALAVPTWSRLWKTQIDRLEAVS